MKAHHNRLKQCQNGQHTASGPSAYRPSAHNENDYASDQDGYSRDRHNSNGHDASDITSAAKSVFIKSYGCQMNVYDSQRMGEILSAIGYQNQPTPEDVDLIILNTCHIREKAAEKIYSEIGRLKKLKNKKPDMLIAIAGCVAQAEGEEIIARATAVDLVFGPQSFHDLPAMLAELHHKRKTGRSGGVVRTALATDEKFSALTASPPRKPLQKRPAAFVTVQEGCDKFCTFCVVPYTRGAEISRPCGDIEQEVRALAAQGVCEITLLGQNVNAWHDAAENIGLAGLLRRLADIDGILRLRFTTSHPCDMDADLLAAHRDLPSLMPYLHLPVQSGSDNVLASMNRRYTTAHYRTLIQKLRQMRPDIALSSDFIVGFPGETDADFEQTLALVHEVNYAQAYSFKYSPRPGTPAAERDDQIDEDIKVQRLAELQAVLNAQQRAFNSAQLGKTLPVLFEKPGKKDGQISGRSPYLQSVHVPADSDIIGKILPVRITAAHDNSLSGQMA